MRETMKTSTTRKQILLAVASALTLGFVSGASAQNFGPPELREIWTDAPGRQVWKNGYGECWHSAFGPPPGYNECNPAPLAQYVPPPAPVVVPPPAPVYVAPPPPKVEPAPVILPPKKDRN
jgi:hypothetical protein